MSDIYRSPSNRRRRFSTGEQIAKAVALIDSATNFGEVQAILTRMGSPRSLAIPFIEWVTDWSQTNARAFSWETVRPVETWLRLHPDLRDHPSCLRLRSILDAAILNTRWRGLQSIPAVVSEGLPALDLRFALGEITDAWLLNAIAVGRTSAVTSGWERLILLHPAANKTVVAAIAAFIRPSQRLLCCLDVIQDNKFTENRAWSRRGLSPQRILGNTAREQDITDLMGSQRVRDVVVGCAIEQRLIPLMQDPTDRIVRFVRSLEIIDSSPSLAANSKSNIGPLAPSITRLIASLRPGQLARLDAKVVTGALLSSSSRESREAGLKLLQRVHKRAAQKDVQRATEEAPLKQMPVNEPHVEIIPSESLAHTPAPLPGAASADRTAERTISGAPPPLMRRRGR